jgi:hypothetical protein
MNNREGEDYRVPTHTFPDDYIDLIRTTSGIVARARNLITMCGFRYLYWAANLNLGYSNHDLDHAS